MKNLILLIPLLGLMVGCVDDWGQKDPIPGVEKNAIFGKVATYNFGKDLFGAELDTVGLSVGKLTYNVGSLGSDSYALVLEEDSVEYGLHIKSSFIEFKNPYASTVAGLASGFGVTFWVKQETDEKAASLIQFYDAQGESSCVEFTSDGVLSYNGSALGNSSSPLSPSNMWHYVALQVLTTGYTVLVDGVKVVDEPGDEDIYTDLIYYVANCAKCCILYNTQATWFSQLNFYRNEMSSTQTDRPESMVAGDSAIYDILIGDEKNTTGEWSAFSECIALTGDGTMHFGFWNYGAGTANWYNFILICSSGSHPKKQETGYVEYFIDRADAWAWCHGDADNRNCTTEGTMSSTFDFSGDTYMTLMKEAYINLDITRKGNNVTVEQTATASDGTLIGTSTWSYDDDYAETIGFTLSLEQAHLILNPADIYVNAETYTRGSYIVGSTSSDNAWWPSDDYDASFSEYYTVPIDQKYPLVFSFYNDSGAVVDGFYEDGNPGANYYFWVIVVTTPYPRTQRGSTYGEYIVVRSDAAGWGDEFDATGLTSTFDWKTYAHDMQGSYHDVGVIREESNVLIRDIGLMGDGETPFPYYSYEGEISAKGDVNVFFTNEHGYMDIVRVAYMPYFNHFDEEEYEWLFEW